MDKRDAIKSPAAAGTAASAAAESSGDDGLEHAFRAAFATPKDTPGEIAAARMAFLNETALVIDSDVPFPLDRAGYADHLAFHAPHWERLEVQLIEVKTAVHGDTGIVSAYFNQRGKPKDAGFRQRPGYVTAVCARNPGGWTAIALHMSPMMAQIIDASPG
jgi:ketosteroid isomerase-like protein